VTEDQARRIADSMRWANGRVFLRAEKGGDDGLRVDVDGSLWRGWFGSKGLDDVTVFNKVASIGRIDLPEPCANVCFGGYRRSRLSMVASRSVHALCAGISGAPEG
jgi:gluconolactonase